MCRVVISGFYGFDNAGDEAILQSMISELRLVYSDINIVVLSANPQKTAQQFNVQAINRSNILHIFQTLRTSDILISGGGGLFQDITSVQNMWYYSTVIILAFLLKKPVFAFAQGIGPIKRSFNKVLLRFIMNRVNGISVRDKHSKNELEKLNVKNNIFCTIDPAFLLEYSKNEDCLPLLQAENGNNPLTKAKIGFSIRKWKGDIDISGIIASVADRASKELNADIFFFPLHYKKDLLLANEIASKMKEKSIIVKGDYSVNQLIGLFGLMDINVCVRFHGLVFSIMNGVPPVAISYDPKIDSLMETLETTNILRYNELNPQSIFNAIKIKWSNKSELSNQINSKAEEFKGLARLGMNEIIQLIKEITSRK